MYILENDLQRQDDLFKINEDFIGILERHKKFGHDLWVISFLIIMMKNKVTWMVISTLIWKNIVFQKQKFKSCLCLPRHSMDHQWIGLDSLVVHSSKITSHSSSLNNLPIPSTTPLISGSKALAIIDLYNYGIGFGIYNHASFRFMIRPILHL